MFNIIINIIDVIIVIINNIINIIINKIEKQNYSYHYQKFAKYQRIYRRNISVDILRSKLPTETFRL